MFVVLYLDSENFEGGIYDVNKVIGCSKTFEGAIGVAQEHLKYNWDSEQLFEARGMQGNTRGKEVMCLYVKTERRETLYAAIIEMQPNVLYI